MQKRSAGGTIVAVALAMALLLPGLLGAGETRNVLILYADDWRFDTLGCAGNPIVKTPHLDALAKDSVRFTNNYVTTSICGVSRATLLTGQWMSRHGNEGFKMFKTPFTETFPGKLRASGYWVGHVGKWHNGTFPKDAYDVGLAYSGKHWIKQPDGTQIHVTQKNEKDALAFLQQRPADKPFCLTVAFFATHAEDGNPEQFLPQRESMKLYENDTIPLPPTATPEALAKLPDFLRSDKNEGRVRWRWRFDEPAKYQKMMKNYYRLATEVDTACGRILDELKKQGLLDSTLVIFTTDNGYYHGEHGLGDKWYPHEESIRVPLIVRDPRTAANKRGSTEERMALNADLAPTILGYAGVAAPAGMQGRDLAALYLAPTPPADWRTEFFYEHAIVGNKERIPASQALVRTDVKYMFWPDYGVEQVFDLKNDRGELNDLVADPAWSAKKAELKAQFEKLREQAK